MALPSRQPAWRRAKLALLQADDERVGEAAVNGLGAESEEKHEPVSDIDTAVVDSLKVLDPAGRLEKRPNALQQNCIVIRSPRRRW
jgi:hypothetical protein